MITNKPSNKDTKIEGRYLVKEVNQLCQTIRQKLNIPEGKLPSYRLNILATEINLLLNEVVEIKETKIRFSNHHKRASCR
jgi:hypothetical protein